MTARNRKSLFAVRHRAAQTRVGAARQGSRLRCLLLIALACCISFPAHADTPAAETVLQGTLLPFVPLHGYTGQPLVQVRVNGTTDATFLLDTGSSFSVILDTLAAQVDLKPYPNGKVMVDGKPFAVFAPRLELGRFNFDGPPSIILSENQLPREVQEKFLGIIGVNILQRFALVIDFQKNTILMIGGGALSDAGLKAVGFTGAVCLPLSYNTDNLPVVQAVFVNGKQQGTEALIVDTGSDNTQISNSLARLLRLPVIQKAGGWQNQAGDFKKSLSQATLKLGDITLPNWGVSFPSSDKVRVSSALGVDVLSHYRVLMDFPARKMYLAPPAPAAVQVAPPAPAAPVSVPKP